MTKTRARKRSPGPGRPPLPPEERAERRINLRLYADEAAQLDALTQALDASETEVIRRALALLSRTLRKKPSA